MTISSISKDVLPLGVEVSTVDLLDTPAGYCETMVFGGAHDQKCGRTYDRDDARLMHDRAVERLRLGRDPFADDLLVDRADDAATLADPRLRRSLAQMKEAYDRA